MDGRTDGSDGPDLSALLASQPERVDADQMPTELWSRLMAERDLVMGSAYVARIKELLPLVVGKTVAGAEAGRAGFALRFTDGSWAAACLADGVLDWKAGAQASQRELRELVDGVERRGAMSRLWSRVATLVLGDRGPVDVSAPVEGQTNPFFAGAVDMEAQVANAIGHQVTKLGFGADCFHFCFEDGHELETFVARLPGGRVGYRVYWVQW